MMTLIERELSAAGIEATGFMDEALLASELQNNGTRLLIIGGGVEDAPRLRLRELCAAHGVKVHEHYGGPTALVDSIESALN